MAKLFFAPLHYSGSGWLFLDDELIWKGEGLEDRSVHTLTGISVELTEFNKSDLWYEAILALQIVLKTHEVG